ncbi:MAG: hypothetical protein JXR37_10815 [Kiritimatiellae bacterium]|nr:hypothetical protein [Kiritimatiellia bacterium]
MTAAVREAVGDVTALRADEPWAKAYFDERLAASEDVLRNKLLAER